MIKGVPLKKFKEIMEQPSKKGNKGFYWTYDDSMGFKHYMTIININNVYEQQSFDSKAKAIDYLNSVKSKQRS